MAIKSSNVAARVEPEIKDKAEAILSKLGISASNGINMFYPRFKIIRGLLLLKILKTLLPVF